MKNVREVFYFAQKVGHIECLQSFIIMISHVALQAVLYPLRLLYDTSAGQLRPECVVALKRIFVLSDADRDHALSDKEFADFQIRCYGDRVQGKILFDAKEVVRNELPSGLNDKVCEIYIILRFNWILLLMLTHQGLTLDGFLFLHHRLVKMGHHERVWTVLKRFGYGRSLSLLCVCALLTVSRRQEPGVLSRAKKV